jgi:putative ABC transport system permease protein
MLLPASYALRNLFVRKSATLLTVLGVAATVAAVSGVLALQQGFARLFVQGGRDDLAVFLRPGATSEGVSAFTREAALRMIKSIPEIAPGDEGQPLAGMECYLAVRREKTTGGETNVPLRGVQPPTFEMRARDLVIGEGRNFTPGSDEVIVGRSLVDRIRDCQVGDIIQINVTPFRVVGIFDTEGPNASEIWGDYDRMAQALQRFGPNRVLAQLRPGTDVEALDERLRADEQTPTQAQTESDYLVSQTEFLSGFLIALSTILGVIMGVAAVFTATNTMLSAIAARTHEIGILTATGFRPLAIFVSFLLEALLLGLIGGLVGCLLVLPLNGIRTGTTNFQTFTEVAFAFRVTPPVLTAAVCFALALGLLGGTIPAWRAARLRPTQALRRG